MSVEILRQAAALMRQRAQDATPGPWSTVSGASNVWHFPDEGAPTVVVPGNGTQGYHVTLRDSWHIASWHPAVALAAADLLDLAATHEKRTGDDRGQGYGPDGRYGYIDPSCSVCGTPDEYAESWPCEYVKRGMALARAYLGGES